MYKPAKHEVFWCNNCDCRKVDSEDASTGHFYLQSGHAFNQATKHYDGEYMMVMYALCKECEE